MSSPSNVGQITSPRNSQTKRTAPIPPERFSSLISTSPPKETEVPHRLYAKQRSTPADFPTFSEHIRPARPCSEVTPAELPTFGTHKRPTRPVSEFVQPRNPTELPTFSLHKRPTRPSLKVIYEQPPVITTFKDNSQLITTRRSSLVTKGTQPAISESPNNYPNVSTSGKRFDTSPKQQRPPSVATEKERPMTLTFTDLDSFDYHSVIDSPQSNRSSAFFLASKQAHASPNRRMSSDDLDSTFDTSDLNDETLNDIAMAEDKPPSPLPPAPLSPFVPRRRESFLDTILGPNVSLNPFAKPGPVDPYVGSNIIVGLTNKTFKPFLKDVDAALVLFYDPWNRNCKWAKMNMREAAPVTQRENHVFAAVDCTRESSLCRRQNITAFTTMKLFAQGKPVSTYLDDSFLSSEQMVSFVENTPTVSKRLPGASECSLM